MAEAEEGHSQPALQAAGVKLVIDHFGHPQKGGAACAGFQAVIRAVDKGRTWIKLSAVYRFESPQVALDCAKALLAHAGPERLLWGSDWPFTQFEKTATFAGVVNELRRWIPDTSARDAMDMTALLVEAGMPAGVLNLVNGDPESMGQEMLDHPALRGVASPISARPGLPTFTDAHHNLFRILK